MPRGFLPGKVRWHLYQIYEKFGITSRTMLRDALGPVPEPPQRAG
ncbi:hypothetical protein [Kitasatospora sp. NPDC096204]